MNSRRYVICDIEATGLDENKDIIEIALITFQDGKVTDVYETLINPLRPVSEFIHDLTSISPKALNLAPKFYDVADAIRMRLEDSVFVSHNTDFDLNLLKKKFEEMDQALKVKSFCTLKVAQYEIPGLRSYNLDALCDFFRIKIQDRHRAIGDARATLELFKELFELRMKSAPKPLYLPQHEKSLKKLTQKSGLLTLKDEKGQILHAHAAFNMEKEGRDLLKVSAENRELLEKTEVIEGEDTGSALIAEFKKLLLRPYQPHWIIVIQELDSGEKNFKVRPYKKHVEGLWFFKKYDDAKAKRLELQKKLQDQTYAYREGGKSKEEIIRHNQKLESLAKDARFPADNLILMGEGRTLGERSFVLVRGGHVLGYGYSEASEKDISERPESFITKRFFMHLGADLAARRYLRVLKNSRHKNEVWRSLAELR
jgi:DNA polymerase-3 subunit epsilon